MAWVERGSAVEVLFEKLTRTDAPLLAGAAVLSRPGVLDALERGVAELRGAGVEPGDVVAIPGGWTAASVSRLFAAARMHAVAALTGAGPVGEARLQAGCAAWVWEEQGPIRVQRPRVHPLLERMRKEGRPGLVLFSSGTTGEPKAVLHDLSALAAPHARRMGKAHRIAVMLGFDHIGGVDVLLGAVASGSTLVVPSGRAPDEVAAVIASEKADVLPATPTLLNLLLLSGAAERHDLRSLRIIAWGAERMPPGLRERCERVFPWVELRQRFGTSETGTLPVADEKGALRFLEGDGYAVRIVDGELWIRTPHAALGYLAGPEEAWRDGWFRTGDLVEPAEGGAWRILGRREEMINVGGEKVAPAEVEDVLAGVEGIAAVRVYGERNPITGQAVAAEVVPAAAVPPEELRRRVRAAAAAQLPPWKVPVRIRIVDALSVTHRGKLERRGV